MKMSSVKGMTYSKPQEWMRAWVETSGDQPARLTTGVGYSANSRNGKNFYFEEMLAAAGSVRFWRRSGKPAVRRREQTPSVWYWPTGNRDHRRAACMSHAPREVPTPR